MKTVMFHKIEPIVDIELQFFFSFLAQETFAVHLFAQITATYFLERNMF